jgi:hypothetical protein
MTLDRLCRTDAKFPTRLDPNLTRGDTTGPRMTGSDFSFLLSHPSLHHSSLLVFHGVAFLRPRHRNHGMLRSLLGFLFPCLASLGLFLSPSGRWRSSASRFPSCIFLSRTPVRSSLSTTSRSQEFTRTQSPRSSTSTCPTLLLFPSSPPHIAPAQPDYEFGIDHTRASHFGRMCHLPRGIP